MSTYRSLTARVCVQWIVMIATTECLLLPFGPSYGDESVSGDDVRSSKVSLPSRSSCLNSAFIATNGIVTFDSGFTGYNSALPLNTTDHRLVAPLFTDLNGTAYYRSVTNPTNVSALWANTSVFIPNGSEYPTPDEILIVTWNTTEYSHPVAGQLFQLNVVWLANTTFIVFRYAIIDAFVSHHPRIGFCTNASSCIEVMPYSTSTDDLHAFTNDSNTEPAANGTYVYRVDRWDCPQGHYCSTCGSPTVCPAGFYCELGASTPSACSDGWYCPHERMSRPYRCPAGYFCPNSLTMVHCPVSGYRCPEGSTRPQRTGSESASMSSSKSQSSSPALSATLLSYASLTATVRSFLTTVSLTESASSSVRWTASASLSSPRSSSVSQSSLPSATLTVEAATVPEPSLVPPWVSSTSSGAMVASVAVCTALTGGAAVDAGMVAMIQSVACSGGTESASISRYLLSPFADLGLIAASIGNLGLMALVALVQFAAWKTLICNGERREDALTTTRTPNISLLAVVVLLQGSVRGAVTGVVEGSALGYVSGAALVVCLGLTSWIWHAALVWCASNAEYRSSEVTHWTALRRRGVPRWLVPRGEWYPAGAQRRYGAVIGSCDGLRVRLAPAAFAAHGCLFASISVLPAQSNEVCGGLHLLLGILALIAAAAHTYFRPHRVMLPNVLSALVSAAVAVMAFAAAMAQWSSSRVSTGTTTLLAVMGVLQSLLILAKCVHLVALRGVQVAWMLKRGGSERNMTCHRKWWAIASAFFAVDDTDTKTSCRESNRKPRLEKLPSDVPASICVASMVESSCEPLPAQTHGSIYVSELNFSALEDLIVAIADARRWTM